MPALAAPPVETKPVGAQSKPMNQPIRSAEQKAEANTEPTVEEQKAVTDALDLVSKKKSAQMPWNKKTDANKAKAETDEKDDKKPETKPAKTHEQSKEAAEKKETKPDTKAEKTESKKEEKPVLRPKPAPAAKPEVDLEKLVSSTVEATAKALKSKEPVKPSQADEVPEARREEWKSIQKAEEGKNTHTGASATALKVFKAEGDYIAKWQADHPDETYDPNSDEHDAWYEKHMPKWMEEAAENGKELSRRESIEKQVEERLAKKYESTNEKLSALEMRDVQRDVERSAPMIVNQGIATAIHAINPELLKEGVKIDETDPLAHEVMMRYGPQIAAESHAAMLLFATRGASMKEGEPLREKIITATNEMEAEILKASDSDRTAPDGRTFVGLNEWANLPEDKKTKHWTITGDLVAGRLAHNSAQEAKRIYDSENSKLEKLATARGWKKEGAVKLTAEEQNQETEQEHETNGKPRSPSTSAKTIINPGERTDAKADSDWSQSWQKKKFGR